MTRTFLIPALALSLGALAGCSAATPSTPSATPSAAPSSAATSTAAARQSASAAPAASSAAKVGAIATASADKESDPTNCQLLSVEEATKVLGAPAKLSEASGLTTGVAGKKGLVLQSCSYTAGAAKGGYSVAESDPAKAKAVIAADKSASDFDPKIGDDSVGMASLGLVEFASGPYVFTVRGGTKDKAIELAQLLVAKIAK